MVATLSVRSSARSEMIDITSRVGEELRRSGLKDGLCTIFVPHTTAGITINENADPSVTADIQAMLDELIPWEAPYSHREGNAAAHIKSSLVGSSVSVLVESGRLRLGTWQGIFLCEFDGPRSRKVYIRFE
jgi:secondary thiamine-phosphate synthase enzyme